MAFRQVHHPYLEAILQSCRQFTYAPQELPALKGVYFVTIVVQSQLKLYYIGEADDIQNRIRTHHRKHEFDLIYTCGIPISIYTLPTPWLSGKERYEREQDFIKELRPLRNDQPWLVPKKDIVKVVKLPKDIKDLVLDITGNKKYSGSNFNLD